MFDTDECRVSIPNLEVVGYADDQENGYQGLRINIQEGGETLDFDAPKMHTLAGTLELYGAVTRFVSHQHFLKSSPILTISQTKHGCAGGDRRRGHN